jgi:hypothetical protein
MQSIFRPASRREVLGELAAGSRRGGGLKMGWTKRSGCGLWRRLWVSIAGSILDEDLKRSEGMSVWDAAGMSRWPPVSCMVSGDEIGTRKNLRNDPRANTASIAWPGQACPE